LAVVVDDADQNITQVVRGSDLLDSTPRQIYLQRLLALATPRIWPSAHRRGSNTATNSASRPERRRSMRVILVRPCGKRCASWGNQPPPELTSESHRLPEILALGAGALATGEDGTRRAAGLARPRNKQIDRIH
jgi:hypothetical protein